jgi:hypothetical protein
LQQRADIFFFQKLKSKNKKIYAKVACVLWYVEIWRIPYHELNFFNSTPEYASRSHDGGVHV